MYEIVFYGKLISGFTAETTKQHVAQLFKTNVEQVERMFTGKRVVIRNKLDLDTAQKYIIAMEKRGAECQIEEMGKPGVAVDPNVAGSSMPETDQVAEQSSSLSSDAQSSATQSSISQPDTAPTNSTQSSSNFDAGDAPKISPAGEPASKSGLNLAGDKADEILSTVHLDLDPVGIRLSEEHQDVAPDLPGLDDLSIAPVGSDLADKKDEVPVSVPDISHLSLK